MYARILKRTALLPFLVMNHHLIKRSLLTYCDNNKTPNTPNRVPCSFTYPANSPSEDRDISGNYDNWVYGGVFDGHGGSQISQLASKELINLVFKRISECETFNELSVDFAIKKAFDDMEKLIVEHIRSSFQIGFGDVARVGTCVLLAMKKNQHLVIANCGDCRAVLGSKTPNNQYFPTIINRDHNCREPLEQLNLYLSHPDEQNLVVCKNSHACYVKGRLQLTRSLGDAYLKYAEFNGSPDKGRTGGRYIPEPYSPPYVSHEPEIHQITLQPEDKFVILGTDGLWDYLPAEEAVQIVKVGMERGEREDAVAMKLVDRALEIAASECQMTLQELKKIPPGRNRRNRHDDTTAVVLYF